MRSRIYAPVMLSVGICDQDHKCLDLLKVLAVPSSRLFPVKDSRFVSVSQKILISVGKFIPWGTPPIPRSYMVASRPNCADAVRSRVEVLSDFNTGDHTASKAQRSIAKIK